MRLYIADVIHLCHKIEKEIVNHVLYDIIKGDDHTIYVQYKYKCILNVVQE